MLYKEDGEYKLMGLLATYMQGDQEKEQYVDSEQRLLPYEEMGHITNLSFRNVEHEPDMLARLEEVKDYPESEWETVIEYVLNNKVLPGTALEMKKKQEQTEALLQTTAMALTEFIFANAGA